MNHDTYVVPNQCDSFFPCYKINCEESYCPYIMSVNGNQNTA